jgi:exonuclease SbcC
VRLDSFKVRGFGPFKKEWSADLSELRGLVAITGVNGAGKSTFLELGLPGALYRQTPTRGSLVDLATARDACLDVTVVNGHRWQIRHLVDAVSGKSECLVVGEDGQPAIPDSKVKSYDAWAATHWPAPEVLLSTIFGAQGAGGFLAAKPSERKAILLRVLGVERLERLAERAREHLKAAKDALAVTAARLADERGRGGDAELLQKQIDAATQSLANAEAETVAAQKRLDNAIEEDRRVADVVRDNAAVVRSRAAIDERLAQIKSSEERMLPDLEERLRNNQAVLAEGGAIRQAVAAVEQLQAKLTVAESELVSAKAAAAAELAPWLDVNERIAAASARADRARQRRKDAGAVQAAKEALPGLRDALAEAEGEVARLTARLQVLVDAHVAGADERLAGTLATLETVHNMCGEKADHEDIGDVVVEALGNDQEAVTAAMQTPVQTKETKERLAAAQDQLATARRQLSEAERLAARSAEVDGAEVEMAEAIQEVTTLNEGYRAAGLAAQEAQARATKLSTEVEQHRAALVMLKPLAGKLPRLDQAETRIAELEPQIAALCAELATLTENRKAFEVLAEVPTAPDLAGFRAAVKRWQDEATQCNRALATLEGQLAAAKASVERQAELGQQEQAQLAEVSDWTRVASDLGKDGLQALEIDAAGPELTALANEILHSTHGPRFTIRIDTQRASADGKRVLEGCDVMVIDTVQGREAAGETFSGGERVILAEACSLAILVLGCRRSGLTDVSLVRDESGAALDPSNARVYVAMLRKAVGMIGARHCLLVSHMPEVQELCDHRIEVGAA